MIEIPEAYTLSKQVNKTLKGKTITKVTAGYTKHKFTWYYGEPNNYQKLLENKTIDNAIYFGSFVEITSGKNKIVVNEGVNLRYIKDSSNIPAKHQLLIKFSDESFLCGFVQMYGGLGCFVENTNLF